MRRKKKIFRPKRRYKIKRRNGNAIKVITGVAATAVLVFVGYSAAGPVSRYLAEKAQARAEEQLRDPEVTDSADLTAARLPDSPVSENEPAEMAPTETVNTDAAASETAAAVKTETEDPADAAAQTEVTEPADVRDTAVQLRSTGAACTVSAEDMRSAESLSSALDDIRAEGYSAVIFPMKTEGGIYNYKTAVPLANTAIDGEDPIRSELTAKNISDEAIKRGLRPVALISVLTDNNRYGDYRDGAYRNIEDDTTWLDTSPDKGGKPWISPFDDTAREFLCDTVRELGEAGFAEIIADDFIFPEFRSSDIERLGEQVAPYSGRYLALTSLASMMTEAGSESDAKVMLRITANSVIKGYSELFYPEELAGCHIAVDYSENNIAHTMIAGGEELILDDMDEKSKVTAVFGKVNADCGDIDTVPMLERSSMTAEEYSDAVAALTAMGYEKYYVY